eukprot:PITA_02665
MATQTIAAIMAIFILFLSGATNSHSYSVSVQESTSSSLGNDCVKELTGLYPCLDFVTNVNIESVTPQCCSGLNTIVNANVMCLCLLFTNNTDTLGVSINQTKALLLPALCKIVVPPVSTCQSHNMGNVPNARTNGSGSGSEEGPTNHQNIRGLSPPDIHASANHSVPSQAVGEAISFVPSIIVSLFIVLNLMA